MPTTDSIGKEKKDGIGRIILNRPGALNALDTAMLHALWKVVSDFGRDTEVRAVIIYGGVHFCAGADIRELAAKNAAEAGAFSRLGHEVFNFIEDLEKPVIAAISGYALGGGCELALACDMRIAGESAKFGQPEINLGLVPGFGATRRLPRLVGFAKAKELILTGRTIGAGEALGIGLINSTVKDEDVLLKAEETARDLAAKSPLVFGPAKRLIKGNRPLREGLESEIRAFAECFETEDHLEGIKAFLEKRPPKFTGR